MSIGTAKPSPTELGEIPHFFIDSHEITEEFSAGDFERQGLALLKEKFVDHDTIILTGGSGLFVRALCEGLDALPKPAAGIREKWNHIFTTEGIESLQKALKNADPAYFERVDIHNPQRLVRALEVFESTGQPFSAFRKNALSSRPFRVVKIGLERERSELYERINLRVDQMIDDGLEEEARSLLAFREHGALKTVGYTEMFDYIDGKISLPQAIEKIKQNTRRYAKRQMTWFKKDQDTLWVHPSREEEILKISLQ